MLAKLNYNLHTLRGDVFGGITSAVVGLPVALAFGSAAGLSPLAGIYGAIAVGFFTAVFSGTRSQISGPTGSMTVAMAVIVTSYADNIAAAFTIVIMAGLIQICIGLLRIGRYVAYTPYSVISGFMTGVGIIIIVVQTRPFIGGHVITGGPVESMRQIPELFSHFDTGAITIAAVTLAVAVLWPSKFSKYLPATLASLVVGILLGVLWLTNAPTIGEIPKALPEIHWPDIHWGILLRAIEPALVIALVGSIDTLLTSLVADSMTRSRHNPDRELLGQGIGNVITGFIGGLPGSGATPSTVANIRAGGWTPVAGILCVVILVVTVLQFGDLVGKIPNAVLAGILIKVGLDTIDWRFVSRMHRVQRAHLLVMLLTLGLTVFLDLVTAVAVGIITSAVTSARQFERLELDSVISTPLLDSQFLTPEGQARASQDIDLDDFDIPEDVFAARVGMVGLRGTFSVASASKLINTISVDIQEHEVVILDFTDTLYVDDSAALVVEQLIDAAISQDVQCIVMGLSGLPATTLSALNVLKKVPDEHFVDNLDEARVIARGLLNVDSSEEPEE